MQQIGLGAVDDPLQRLGQARPHREYVEVLGSQQVIGDLVIDGDVDGAALDDWPLCAQLVGECDGVGPHGGIGDQPALRIAATGE